MGQFKLNISMSLDGFVAGPNQSVENPLGEGGEALHDWALALEAWRKAHGKEGGEVNPSSPILEEAGANVGAHVMGRNMFGGGPGPWDEKDPWNGWWGDDPPFHTPVFVLTHHERDPLHLRAGNVFHFVTKGPRAAYERAREAAGSRDVTLGGGAETAQQYLAAGLLDEVQVSVVPILLGSGSRLFENLGPDVELERVRVVDAPGVTHLKFRVVK